MEFGIVAVFLVLVPGFWALSIHLDKERIRKYITRNGEKQVMSITWRIFGHGWISEANKEDGGNKIYEVEYKDMYGNMHHVWCKTAMLSGVFLSEDRVTAFATQSGKPMTAEEKVAILEEELRKVRAGS